MQRQIRLLTDQINGLLAWQKNKQRQQLSYPIDQASVKTLGALTPISRGNASTQSVSVPSTPTSILVPKATGTLTVLTSEGPVTLLTV